MTRQRIPQVIAQLLTPLDPMGVALPLVPVGSPTWYAWLSDTRNQSFALHTTHGQITMRQEQKRNGWYWYAYRKRDGKLHKVYAGKANDLSPARLDQIALALAGPAQSQPGPAAQLAGHELILLGQPRVLRGGQPVALSTAKAIALLAYLALTGAPQRREHILALLWPESSAEAARKNLRNTLWTIRTTLGPDMLHADDRLALSAEVAIDVRRFEQEIAARAGLGSASDPDERERLETALARYQGQLLDGLTLADAPEFELWLSGERERLSQLYTRALQTLVDLQRRAGQWPQMLGTARRALAHDPLQEPLYRALMEAHARLGQRPEALRQYETLRALLDQELGVAPLPATEELRVAIISGEIGPAPSTPTATPADRHDCRPPRAEPSSAPFVGRSEQLDALDAELAAATAGHPRVVLLTGEIGIGKSRLWQAWTDHQPPEVALLETRCAEATAMLPFAPLLSIFNVARCREQQATAQHGQPPMLELPTPLPYARQLPPDEERHRVFEAFVQGLRACASRPLILFVDDVQWADRATLEWLGYLVECMRDRPLLLVLSYRVEDAPTALVRLVAQWSRQGLTHRIPLQRLAPGETATLVAALGGDPARSATLHAESAGNPYFVSELLRAAPGDVPAALADLLRTRLDALPETARQLLQAAAVLDPDIDFATLRQISGRSEDETLDALELLLEARVLAEQDAQYSFAHPLVAHVVRSGMLGARRAILHRRAAEAREQAYAGRLPAIAGRLALHYREAGDRQRAAVYAELAAEHALSLVAIDEAIAFYRQAIALEPTPARQLGLGHTLFRQSDLHGAEAAFTAAFQGFEAAGDRRGAARASLRLAETSLLAGQITAAMGWGDRSLAYLTTENDPEAQVLAHFLFGANPLLSGQSLASAETHLTSAVHLALEHGLIDQAARGRFTLGNLQAEHGNLPAALQSYREAIRLAQTAGDHFQEVLAHNNAAYHALLLGEIQSAHEHAAIGLALAEQHGLRLPLQYLYSTHGEIALAEARWSDAEQWFTRGIDEAEHQHNQTQIASYRANLGLAARGRGDLDAAVVLLEAARETIDRLAAAYLHTQIDLWLAELYAERREHAAAEDALSRAEQRLAESDHARLRAWAARLRQGQPAASTRLNEHSRRPRSPA